MTRLVVHCGLCGYEPGIELEVSEHATRDELRAAVAERLGRENLRCERCHSELVPESGTVEVVEPQRVSVSRMAEQMRKRIHGVRFAVGSPDDPRGTVWRVWVHRDDVYIAARGLVGEMKVSLHASGKWRAGFTEQHMEREDALIPKDRDRAVDKWERPPEFATGWTRAFSIVVPASEVVPSEVVIAEPEEIIWVDPATEGWATHFTVLFAAPGAMGSEGRGFATAADYQNATDVVTAIELARGERVWVVAHNEPMDAGLEQTVVMVREKVLAEGGEALAKARDDPEPHDLRGFAGGDSPDGARFYLDIALPD